MDIRVISTRPSRSFRHGCNFLKNTINEKKVFFYSVCFWTWVYLPYIHSTRLLHVACLLEYFIIITLNSNLHFTYGNRIWSCDLTMIRPMLFPLHHEWSGVFTVKVNEIVQLRFLYLFCFSSYTVSHVYQIFILYT